jgi:arginase
VVEDDDILQRDYEQLPNSYARLFYQVQGVAGESDLKLILGGDHSISLSTIPALRSHFPRLKVIWVDAHGDVNTPLSSLSDNLHGMPVAALLGLFDVRGWQGWDWFTPSLEPSDIAYIGVRDLDVAERNVLNRLGIIHYGMKDIEEYGMGRVVEMALQNLDPLGRDPIHLSFDIDSVDPQLAQATGVKVPDGLMLTDCLRLGHCLKETGRMVSCEIVEVNPLLALGQRGSDQTRLVVQALLGALLSVPISPQESHDLLGIEKECSRSFASALTL